MFLDKHLAQLAVGSFLFFFCVILLEYSYTHPPAVPLQENVLSHQHQISLPARRWRVLKDSIRQHAIETPAKLQEIIPGDGHGFQLKDPAIIIFCYNRSEYLNRTLESLAPLQGLGNFTLYVSQDGDNPSVSSVADFYGNGTLAHPYTKHFEHWHHPRLPLPENAQPSHAWLSQHYRWGLHRLFQNGHSHAVIIEDDMLFSPDFLTYFQATAVLLERDPSLWCISSWNDNAVGAFSWSPHKLFRTSYFPGLGWMMRREVWEEMGPSFPNASWDHWMRLNSTSLGRECIVPELSRNHNIGEKGANMDRRVYRSYLARLQYNEHPVQDFGDLSYLLLPSYEQHARNLVATAQLWETSVLRMSLIPDVPVVVIPYKAENYARLVRGLRVWTYPRGHHRHLTILPHGNTTILLAEQRFCPYLPLEHRILPSPALAAVRAPRNTSCTAFCQAQGLECSPPDFWFINDCAKLREHFPCERGCGMELGRDVPNYVVDASLPDHAMCLTTQEQPRCEASHPGTARLCPCVDALQLSPPRGAGSGTPAAVQQRDGPRRASSLLDELKEGRKELTSIKFELEAQLRLAESRAKAAHRFPDI